MAGDVTMVWLGVASVALLLVHIAAQVVSLTLERGAAWNAGPRDQGNAPHGRLAGRADRALRNFQETFPAFVLLAVMLMVLQRADGVGLLGALIWLVARGVYLPLYLTGVPYLRTLVWLVSLAGLSLMAVRAVF